MTRPPLIRQGEGQADAITRYQTQQRLDRQRFEQTLKLVIEDNAPALHARKLSIATAAGDERKLRGIPAIGRGVTGAINGTSPHQSQ